MFLSLIFICFLVGLICMMFITPIQFAKGIRMIVYDEIPEEDRLSCYIPFYNIVSAEKLYTGRTSKVLIASCILLLSFLFRLLVLFFLYSSVVIQVASVILLVSSVVLCYLANAYIVFLVLHDSDTIGIIRQLLYAVVFPMGQNYIGVYLPAAIYAMRNREEAF